MRSISENDLAVVIPLLAAKLRDLALELRTKQQHEGDLSEAEIDDLMQLQDMQQQYASILDSLRAEYEAALAEGIHLPSYEALTQRFRVDPP